MERDYRGWPAYPSKPKSRGRGPQLVSTGLKGTQQFRDDGQRGSACAGGSTRDYYERRRPEETTLYQLVQKHLQTFLAQVELETGAGLPDFVKDEFDASVYNMP